MEIGDWKSTQGLNDTFRKARELGIESNLLELEAFGFTVVRAYKAAPKAFFDRMRDTVDRKPPATFRKPSSTASAPRSPS